MLQISKEDLVNLCNYALTATNTMKLLDAKVILEVIAKIEAQILESEKDV